MRRVQAWGGGETDGTAQELRKKTSTGKQDVAFGQRVATVTRRIFKIKQEKIQTRKKNSGPEDRNLQVETEKKKTRPGRGKHRRGQKKKKHGGFNKNEGFGDKVGKQNGKGGVQTKKVRNAQEVAEKDLL